MKTALRILHLEDDPKDAELIRAALEAAGFAPEIVVVQTKADYLAQLKHGWDLVLADYKLPQFDGLQALALFKERALDVSFILISGTIGEETAVAALHAGASDFVLKNHLGRLGPAVERGLREAVERRARKAAEEQLSLSSDRTRRILRAASVGLWEWNLLTDAVYFSPEWKRQLGFADDELANRFDEWQKRVQPEDLARALAAVDDFRNGRVPRYSVEIRMLHRDGSWRWILGEADLERNEKGEPMMIMGSHIDITARKQAESVARYNEERYRQLFEKSMDAVLQTTPDGEILTVNPAACALFALTEEEIVHRGRAGIVDTSDPRLAELLQARSETGSARGEMRMRRGDGIFFDAEVSSNTYPNSHGGRLTSILIRDITERKETEAARASLEAQLRESQKMEAMGTLAGGIAHDFNNIVAVILGNAGLASKEIGTADDRARLRVNEITKAAARARSLIEQILTFSRRQPHSMQQVSLQPLVHEALALLRATLPAAVQLHHDLAVQALAVVGNATQIEQVVLNLCTNAWQAGAGEIWINLEQRAVDLADDAHVLLGLPLGQYACLAVRDNGSGMDEGTQARIFEPFFTSKAIGQGTGLGLSVVHGIVTQHRGAITVQSRLGAGSTFMVLLPLVLADAPVRTQGVVPAPSPVPAGRGQHIVYVDDDESMLFLAKSILENSGYRVTYCLSGELALEAITEVGGAIDLLVTDYNLTGMSGLDLVRKVREQGHGMAAVITSGFVTEELLEGASRLMAVEVISKPDTMAELRGLIDRLLGESGVW